jgi:hypothetical protein
MHEAEATKGELPPDFRVMEMHEIEDILCIDKRYFAGGVSDLEDARACWAGEGVSRTNPRPLRERDR